jgi:FkbM family methyltransferase
MNNLILEILRGLKGTFRDSPDISFKALVKAFGVKCCTVVHCGAGLVEEVQIYHDTNFGPIYWIEAHPDIFQAAKKHLVRFPEQKIIEAALWDECIKLKMNVASNLGSSSLLKSHLHAEIFPEITFLESFTVKTKRLDEIQLTVDYGSLLVMDLQGAELKALRGAWAILPKFNYIYIEVAELELYEGAPQIREIVDFLYTDFELVDWQISKRYGYGNLFFIRNDIVKLPRLRRIIRLFLAFGTSIQDIIFRNKEHVFPR